MNKMKYEGVKKVLFLGSKPLGLRVLQEIYDINSKKLVRIITFDDSNDQRSCLQEFKIFSDTTKIELNILNGPSGLKSLINKCQPDLVLVVGWYWIIPRSILNIVKYGFIGIHGSLLPKYRGFSPFVWSLINGEKKTGISLFYFSDGIDSGDIIAQKEIKINQDTTIADILTSAENKSIEIIRENFEKILECENSRTVQTSKEISYCGIRKPEDGLINWNNENLSVYNFIRAQSDPYPGAFSFINKRKYYIKESELVNTPYYGTPGLVVNRSKNSIIVCCGTNAIKITKLHDEFSQKNIVSQIGFSKRFK